MACNDQSPNIEGLDYTQKNIGPDCQRTQKLEDCNFTPETRIWQSILFVRTNTAKLSRIFIGRALNPHVARYCHLP
jgi:hypothetical protein